MKSNEIEDLFESTLRLHNGLYIFNPDFWNNQKQIRRYLNYHKATLKEIPLGHPYYYFLCSGYKRKEPSKNEQYLQRLFEEEGLKSIRKKIRKRIREKTMKQDLEEAQRNEYLLEQMKKNLRKKFYRVLMN
ncbi:MAG: hypothetical protein ACFFB5_14460 [Promethearchaeota archaeon]